MQLYYFVIFLLILISWSYLPICIHLFTDLSTDLQKASLQSAVYLFVFFTNKLRPMFSWTSQLYRITYLLLYLWAQYLSEDVWANRVIHPRIRNNSTKGVCSALPSSQSYLQRRNTHTKGWVGPRVTLDTVGRKNISFPVVNRTHILWYSSSSFVSVLTKFSWLLV
jgi:hypothetical protein